MLGKTHAASGVAVWLLAAPLVLPVTEVFAGVAVAALGALLPDIDHSGSKVSRALGPLRHLTSKLFKHRGFTHYALTAVIVSVGLSFVVPVWLAGAVGLGMLVHSLGDCCTREGIRLLWPVSITLRGPLVTGGMIESLLVLPACIVVSGWQVWSLMS